jgi:hypothetical protein
MQPVTADGVVRRHEHTNVSAEKIFEVLTAVGDAPGQVSAAAEFIMTVWLIMMVSVEHDLVATRGDPEAEVLDKGSVLVKRVNRPSATILLGNSLARSSAMERNHRERNRAIATQFTVGLLELFWRREEAGVIVADAELHATPNLRLATRP